MKVSVKKTANYIFKLHAAVLAAWRNEKYQNVFVYPVMDGVYITATSKDNIEKIIVRIYLELAKILVKEHNPECRFVIRGSVAYGETIHGHNVPYSASKIFETDLNYKNNILLGSAMIRAYAGEGCAAPFGVLIDESASKGEGRSKKNGSFPEDWKWFDSKVLKIDAKLINNLKSAVNDYFEKLKNENHPCHYPVEKIEKHQLAAKKYFNL